MLYCSMHVTCCPSCIWVIVFIAGIDVDQSKSKLISYSYHKVLIMMVYFGSIYIKFVDLCNDL